MSAHQCNKCGKVSRSKANICDPTSEVASFYVCDDCSKHSIEPEALCKPLEMHPKYFCKSCGTPGVKPDSLCKPKKIFG
jgi:predicted RNA-binding Zn-ribbon protein involved in translation (DUF1610 family)